LKRSIGDVTGSYEGDYRQDEPDEPNYPVVSWIAKVLVAKL